MKKTKAPIDEKNVCSDFIYEMFDVDYIERINRTTTHLVGFRHNRLLEVWWSYASNVITFAFVDLHNNKHTEEDERNLQDFIKCNGETLDVVIKKIDNTFVTYWYFMEEKTD